MTAAAQIIYYSAAYGENAVTHAYQKLGIPSRERLPAALG